MPTEPNFSAIPPELVNQAWKAWEAGDAFVLMMLTGNQHRGRLLFDNLHSFKAAGIYEAALFNAYTHGPHLRPRDWQFLFTLADREKLATCGDPLPSNPIEVYRGVSDRRHRKWIRGLSWTTNPNTAAWFAIRHARPYAVPAVYSLRVKPEEILCITNDREEEEVMVAAWDCGRMKRLEPMPESIKPD